MAISEFSDERSYKNLVIQKKHLEIARYFYEKGNRNEAIRNLKIAQKEKVKYKYYLNDIEDLLLSI